MPNPSSKPSSKLPPIQQASPQELQTELAKLEQEYDGLIAKQLKLDLTRGKPSTEQVSLADGLDGALGGNYVTDSGVDVRNYGGIDGIPEAKAFFGELMDSEPEQTLIGGNSSLTLMYLTLDFLTTNGTDGEASAWGNQETIKFICPVPGYDRHFSICEHLGIEMVTVPMLDNGPDMDAIESLVKEDASIRGMWCVPRFSNPTGCVYSDQTVDRIAKLGQLSKGQFIVMWDNAYAIHAIDKNPPALKSIFASSAEFGTEDSIIQFGSTSKISFAGAGVAYMSSSVANMAAFKKYLGFQTIGPDKVNQLRHLRFFKDHAGLQAHMDKHAAVLAPRFELVLDSLERELADTGMGSWTRPQGGYFVSFDSLPGLANTIIGLAKKIGVSLTPAGATFPYGKDPQDSNIRIAPSYPSLEDLDASMKAFVLCVKLASVRQALAS